MSAAVKYDYYQVAVPRVEGKRFQTIVRALGYTLKKSGSLVAALADIEEGRVYEVSSLEQLKKEIG